MQNQPHNLVLWENLKDVSLLQGNGDKLDDRCLLLDMGDNN